ncbi:MAG: HesA/MoeB/ThiF family protein [Pirellulales bacterium]
MTDAAPLPPEFRRYARQIGPGALSLEGQLRLSRSTAFITRAGGVGGTAALGLVTAGVGRVIIAHGGEMIEADLNRQLLGGDDVVGKPRAEHFAARLWSMNRQVEIEAIDHEPDEKECLEIARRADVLVAGPPTFAERLRLNRAAVADQKPLVDAAQWGLGGTLTVVQPGVSACLACLYPEEPPFEEFFPVVGAIASAIGSLAALEAIKILSGTGHPLIGRMLVYDGQSATMTEVKLHRRSDCPVCGSSFSAGTATARD